MQRKCKFYLNETMAVSMMLYGYLHKEDINDGISENDFRDYDDPLKVSEKQVCKANIAEQVETIHSLEATDPIYIKLQVFDDILE